MPKVSKDLGSFPHRCKCGSMKFKIMRRKLFHGGSSVIGRPVCFECGKPLFREVYKGVVF